MKTNLAILLTALIVAFGGSASAQDTAKTPASKPPPSVQELEAKLIATLTNAKFTGRWCGVKDGQLGPDKEDSYTVVSVKKLGGDNWQINAEMLYGGKSIEVPVPAQVKWAGDTPVLILDQVSMGTPRAYSARVLIYENTYAGWWTAPDHGGLLNGVITHGRK